MKKWRLVLYPFALIYNGVTAVRNVFYNLGIFKSTSFDLPIVVVGNLSVGGTGKTPQIEYLIRLFSELRTATVSRGYKRKTTGFVLANPQSTVADLGDEPFQFFQKFPQVQVAVDSNRVEAIQNLLNQPQAPELILLDDAMQHRKVKAGFYILLTSYGDLFCDDFVLPAGNLRENRTGAKRADVIVVTKCPQDLPPSVQEDIVRRIQPAAGQQVFFSAIAYDACLYGANHALPISDLQEDFVLVAGIAKPKPFFDHLKKSETLLMEFPDHHNFTTEDIEGLLKAADGKKIITTEKDYVRLKGLIPESQLYYLPIKSVFLKDSDLFEARLVGYVNSQPDMKP
ncbi:MAG: tetraacyldisaccharide 4'-kinase [Flavobacterium sp.]|nr:tetraacyldisaccharide 4'-kinase [Candidatus Neoflavobacterium equi]